MTTSMPKIMCKRCGKILDYPYYKLNGTNGMRRHLKGESCQKSANGVANNLTLPGLFQKNVSIYYLIYIKKPLKTFLYYL